MNSQLALDLTPLTEPLYLPTDSIADRFVAFHEENPHVANALEALAAQWLIRHKKVGMKALVERLRWESGIQTDGDVWRLNNSFTSHYARLLLARRPDWADRIETRVLRAVA